MGVNDRYQILLVRLACSILPHMYVSLATTTLTDSAVPQDHSPAEIQHIVAHASEHDLITSKNTAYMRLQLTVAQLTNEKSQLELSKRATEDDNVRLRMKCEVLE